MKKERKVIYYEDELNDEFAEDHIIPKYIDENYSYLREKISDKLAYFFWYRVIAVPIAFIYMKVHFHHKIVNKKILKAYNKDGYFMYGNHTHFMADALIPTMINMPKRVSVIVHSNNVSMPYLGRITPYLGALPLPDTAKAGKNFISAIERRIEKKGCITIYPEAHIWPYYTDIRPFKDSSFKYPLKYGKPVFCFTNTYHRRRFSKTPQIVTYVDGPFLCGDETAGSRYTQKERKQNLRNQVYQTMKKRADSDVVLVEYRKKER